MSEFVRQTDRQTDRPTDRPTGGRTDGRKASEPAVEPAVEPALQRAPHNSRAPQRGPSGRQRTRGARSLAPPPFRNEPPTQAPANWERESRVLARRSAGQSSVRASGFEAFEAFEGFRRLSRLPRLPRLGARGSARLGDSETRLRPLWPAGNERASDGQKRGERETQKAA